MLLGMQFFKCAVTYLLDFALSFKYFWSSVLQIYSAVSRASMMVTVAPCFVAIFSMLLEYIVTGLIMCCFYACLVDHFLVSISVVLQYNTMQCNAMQCNAMQCNAMQCNAMQCNAMQCNAMQCNAMQCNAMQCNAMQCNAMQCNAMQCNAMQCNAMQCNAIQYNTLHYITLHYITLHYITLHYITLHYITLYYITIQYNTLKLYCPGPGHSLLDTPRLRMCHHFFEME